MEVPATSDQPVSTLEVEKVLAGTVAYDDASPKKQAEVWQMWDHHIAQARTRGCCTIG